MQAPWCEGQPLSKGGACESESPCLHLRFEESGKLQPIDAAGIREGITGRVKVHHNRGFFIAQNSAYIVWEFINTATFRTQAYIKANGHLGESRDYGRGGKAPSFPPFNAASLALSKIRSLVAWLKI